MGKKGIIGFLLAGGIVGIIVLVIVIVVAYFATNSVPAVCWVFDSMGLSERTGVLCWWIQFLLIIFILRKILPVGK